MRFSQESLENMAREDYRAFEKRMCAWASAAEAELQSGEEPRQMIFDLLFCANTEFTRRRYMKLWPTESEWHAKKVLRTLAERMFEKEWEQ